MQDGRRHTRNPPSLLGRTIGSFLYLPAQVASAIKPYSPQLVPFIVCLAVIPFLVFFSFVAGWLVWASVPRGWAVPVYLQYGNGRPPYAEFTLPKLVPGQQYGVALHISAASIPSNYEIGNFMTSLTIVTADNSTIASARIPSVILPPSWSIPLPLLQTRSIEHTIPLLHSFKPQTSRTSAYIQIGREDGWKSLGHGGGRELTVISTELRGAARPEGLQAIISRFPLTLAFAAAISFFCVSGFIVVLCLLPTGQTTPNFPEIKEEPPLDDAPPVTDRPAPPLPAVVDDDADGFENHDIAAVLSSRPATPPETADTPLSKVRRRLQTALETGDEA